MSKTLLIVIISVSILIILIVLVFYFSINKKYDMVSCESVSNEDTPSVDISKNILLKTIIKVFNSKWNKISGVVNLDPWLPDERIDSDVYTEGDFFNAISLVTKFTKCIGCSVSQVASDAGTLKRLDGIGNIIVTGVKQINGDTATLYIGMSSGKNKINASITDMKLTSSCECGFSIFKNNKQSDLIACKNVELECTYCDYKYIATVDFVIPSISQPTKGKFKNLEWSSQVPIVKGTFDCNGIIGASTILSNITGSDLTTEILKANLDTIYKSLTPYIIKAMNSVFKYIYK